MSTMMLVRTLEQWGFEVVMAHDGAAAWECIVGDSSRTRSAPAAW
jgi:hypothetical protein